MTKGRCESVVAGFSYLRACMYRVEQVLVPLDFSSHSKAALAFAQDLPSAAPGAGPVEMQLVHAMAPMPAYMRAILYPYAALGEDDREVEAELLEGGEERLRSFFEIDEKLEKRFLNAPNLQFGHPRELVARWAGKYSSELIVVGAFGEGGSFVGGLGSTTRRLLEVATEPVLVVRDFERRPKIERILVATDLDRKASKVIEVAVGMALQLGAKVELVFVFPSPYAQDLHGLLRKTVRMKPEELLQKGQKTVDALFERAIENLEFPFQIREEARALVTNQTIRIGEAAEEILATAQETGADLVVVGSSRQKKGSSRSLGSVAEGVLLGGSTHVLVVPPSREESLLVDE